MNGELYEADAARERLQKETGYMFKGKSDCEIVIALYQLYGTSFIKYLRGEFALCLYDSRTKTFLAARDRYGIKPLFYAQLDGSLLVAAEVKAFAPFGLKAEWDVQGLTDRGYVHDQRTIFKGVNKVSQSKRALRTQILKPTKGQARSLLYLQCLRPRRPSELLGSRISRQGKFSTHSRQGRRIPNIEGSMRSRPVPKMNSSKASVNAFWKLFASGYKLMCELAFS